MGSQAVVVEGGEVGDGSTSRIRKASYPQGQKDVDVSRGTSSIRRKSA